AVPENEIDATVLGQQASVDVPALGNKTFSGKIEQKGISANPVSHTYEVKIGINNPQLKLMPGMVCKVLLKQNTSQTVIIVPNRTVQVSHEGKHFVWLAEENIAKRRFVQTGTLSNEGVTITDGLCTGDKLIVEGYQKVSEGMRISY
ncbi:MAG: efflux RND transporter periplasmic adaptor subunit, partial [Prevotellaceae bacterium]|nr:efflux RND transporter periplasmic adaptor subunit [Prevotellaceae bacterium]